MESCLRWGTSPSRGDSSRLGLVHALVYSWLKLIQVCSKQVVSFLSEPEYNWSIFFLELNSVSSIFIRTDFTMQFFYNGNFWMTIVDIAVCHGWNCRGRLKGYKNRKFGKRPKCILFFMHLHSIFNFSSIFRNFPNIFINSCGISFEKIFLEIDDAT